MPHSLRRGVWDPMPLLEALGPVVAAAWPYAHTLLQWALGRWTPHRSPGTRAWHVRFRFEAGRVCVTREAWEDDEDA